MIRTIRPLALFLALAMISLMAPAALAAPTATADPVPATIGQPIADIGATVTDVTITKVKFDKKTSSLLASGTVDYTTATGEAVTQDFKKVALDVSSAAASDLIGTQQARCDILFLDLGPINLDLLGLVVDLSAVQLDVFAVPGPGNLLGNLLCAVAGLLDPGGALSGLLGSLLNGLADLINQLLGQLGGLSLA